AVRGGGALPAAAIAGVGRVAGARRWPANEGARHAVDGVGRAFGARPGAVVGDVARAGRRPAGDRRWLEAVRRAVVVRAVAVLRDVAWSCRGPAFRGALAVGRTGRARARAVLGRVADAGRGPTLDRARQERVGWAVVV